MTPVVVFDLDDTLFRERDFCRGGFRYLIDKYGWPVSLFQEMDEELTNRRNPFNPLEKYLSENFPVAYDIKDLVKEYRCHRPERLQTAPGMREVLAELKSRGVRLALITDGRSITQRNKIAALGLEEFFSPENIYISEETGFDKLSDHSFRMIQKGFPDAAAYYYVGDNQQKDFVVANGMGWITLKVPYNSDNVHPDIEHVDSDYSPKINLADNKEILKIIK